VTFARLTRGDWLAVVAALALLLVMAMDWYSTDAGEQARDAQHSITPRGPVTAEASKAVQESAESAAAKAEKNAWQADPFPDRLILFALLATIALALAAAWLRAAGRRFEPPWTPSALATGVGLGAALLLAARILQKPSAEPGAVIKLGAPLGLVCVGTVVLGARAAWNAERDGSAWGEEPADKTRSPVDRTADTDETDAVRKPPPLFDHEMPADAAGAPTATAVRARPEVTDQPPPADDDVDEAWAPDWNDPAQDEPAAQTGREYDAHAAAQRRRRRRRARTGGRGARKGRGGRR